MLSDDIQAFILVPDTCPCGGPQVGEAVERSGPLHRLGSKLAEIRAGLGSVGERLEQRSPSVAEAERTQKVSRGPGPRRPVPPPVSVCPWRVKPLRDALVKWCGEKCVAMDAEYSETCFKM